MAVISIEVTIRTLEVGGLLLGVGNERKRHDLQ